jgi:hypothetical protein
MRKAFLLFCLFWVAFFGKSFAQLSGNNSVYLELGGNAGLGSLNYERLFPVRDNLSFAGRVGGLYLPDGKKNYVYMLPAELSVLWGENALKFESGFGFTYFKYVNRDYSYYDGVISSSEKLFPVLRLGTRRQVGESPFFFRSAFTFIFIETVTLGKFPIPWLGISAGYSFGKRKK